MKKDPTEFRQRFAAWKNGKKPYLNGLPKYEDGKPNKIDWSVWDNVKTTPYRIPFVESKATTLTDAGYATGAVLSTNLLDSIADNADRAGLPLLTALGLAVKESTLGNPTDDRSAWNLSSDIRRAFNNKYPGTELHINYGRPVEGDQLINYYKGSLHPGGGKKSTLQQGFEFYKKHPDKYNPGLKNYQKLVDKRGVEVMLSPEVLKWLKERNIKKATGRFNRINPLLDESKFNLPKYEDGKNGGLLSGIYIGAIPMVQYMNNKAVEQNKIVDNKIASINNYGWDNNSRSYFFNSPQWLKNNVNPAWNILDVNALKIPFGMQDMSKATKDDNIFFQRHLGYPRNLESMPITGIRFSGDYNEDGTLRLPYAEYTGLSKQAKDFIRKGILEGKILPNEDGSWTEIKERRKRWGKYTSHLGTYSIRENNGSGIYDVVDTYDFPWYNPILNRLEGKQIEIRDTIHGPNANPRYYNLKFSKKKK